MKLRSTGISSRRSRLESGLLSALFILLIFASPQEVVAHPLGNFSINHFARIEPDETRVRLRYVVDMAEIPTFQESQSMDTDGDGSLSEAETRAYVERVVSQYADSLVVTVDGARVTLRATAQSYAMPKGESGLQTLRVVCDFEGDVPPPAQGTQGQARRLSFRDANYQNRPGWREIVVAAPPGVTVFDSNAFGSALTDELKAYPEDLLAAPLNERAAEFSWAAAGTQLPAGAKILRARDGKPVGPRQRDRLAELINVERVTPLVALLGLLIAAGLGAAHALSPGHGKTVVGAYLVGSRGTAKHAAFLGLTVTITHTAGVFALGVVTLFASAYVVPERLFPILSLVSGALVLVIGLSLFIRRLRTAINGEPHHAHAHESPSDAHEHSHDEASQQAQGTFTHSHGGGAEHTHLPPGAGGTPVTWRSLLALGVAGGLLPCPSALVVLLAAISAGRVAYGLALVVAFSVGLAATLTAVGLLFVYAGGFVKKSWRTGHLSRVLPVASALVITCVGAVMCYEALGGLGVQPTALAFAEQGAAQAAAGSGGSEEQSLASLGAFALLGLGLVFGLKHATEADHVVAVSTIVSEQRNLLRAALVGGLWGVGHTASLLVVGAVVLVMRVAIPELVSGWLEFGIALMIIGLGVSTLVRALRGRADAHLHRHAHDGVGHAHIHFHESDTEHAVSKASPHSHAVSRIGLKPLLVGAAHGLAGSAALTLLVLTQVKSAALGLLYLAVFGVGSVLGMLLMSSLVGLPFALGAKRLSGVGLQVVAGVLSIAFGLWYAYETGFAGIFHG